MTAPGARPLVVLGDALLDVDVVGAAHRLAPDAPVPVVEVEHEVTRPGGAGLAALLALRLAGSEREVVLVTPLADDAAADTLRALLQAAGVRVVPLGRDAGTPVKRRIRAGGQSVVRLDEGGPAVPEPPPHHVSELVAGAAAVLVSDYGQGLTAVPGLNELLAGAGGPVVWDPHPRGAAPVPGVRLVTPSEAEARRFTEQDRPTAPHRFADLSDRLDRLLERWGAHAVALTLGADGAMLSHGDGPPTVVPTGSRVEGGDVCGAGDCFSAAAALSLARRRLVSEAVADAVTAAERFVADGGAAAIGIDDAVDSGTVDRSEPAEHAGAAGVNGTAGAEDDVLRKVRQVRAAGGSVVATGGCFDLVHAGHVEALRAARSLGDFLVVLVNSDASVRRLKGRSRPVVPVADRARVLAAFESVDAVVVFDEDTPVRALERLRPDVWAKGGDYSVDQLPEATVLRRWGGQTVVLPYLDGRSTTSLMEHLAARPE